jgi:glycosyltransferase involved in cell wall biosynthesis
MSHEAPERPLVSVIIPTSNSARFVRRAVESARRQSGPALEIVVVDNCSTDGTADRIRAMRDERITIERFDNRGVIAAARNRGAGLARGDWLAFLDSDDCWAPGKLEACGGRFADADVLYHDMRRFGHLAPLHRVRRRMRSFRPAEDMARSLARSPNAIILSSLVMRAELFRALGGFDESAALRGIEDFDLLLRAADRRARFRRVGGVLGGYRLHQGNFSRDQRRRQGAHIALYRKLERGGIVERGDRAARAQRALLLCRGAGRSAARLACYAWRTGTAPVRKRAALEIARLALLRAGDGLRIVRRALTGGCLIGA